MPQMADITVKKSDGTTNVVWSSKSPAAGDKSAAVWKSDTVSNVPAARPEFTLSSEDAVGGKARRLISRGKWPKQRTDAQNNLVVTPGCTVTSNFVVDQSMTSDEIKEFSSQYAALVASALVQECLRSGYSAI